MAWQQITDPVQMRELADLRLLYLATSAQPEPMLLPDDTWVFPHVASFFYCIQVEA